MPDDTSAGNVNLYCTNALGVDKVMPGKLSMRAHKEIQQACLKLKEVSNPAAGGGQTGAAKPRQVTGGAFAGLSQQTWSELRDAAARAAMLKSADEPSGVLRKKDPKSLTEGAGFDVFVPIKVAKGTDVKLFLNIDPAKVAGGSYKPDGAGASIEYRKGGTAAEARFYVDTTSARPNGAGYIGLSFDLGGK